MESDGVRFVGYLPTPLNVHTLCSDVSCTSAGWPTICAHANSLKNPG